MPANNAPGPEMLSLVEKQGKNKEEVKIIIDRIVKPVFFMLSGKKGRT